MEQKQKTVLIIFCTLFAFLFINALVGTGMLVVSGNVGGLLGELFGDMDLLPLFEMNSSGPSSEIKLPEEAGTETQAVEDLVTQRAVDYMALTEAEGYVWGTIRTALATVSDLAVIQMQDVLDLGAEARMNFPGTSGSNWTWRALPGSYNKTIAQRLCRMATLYGRNNNPR